MTASILDHPDVDRLIALSLDEDGVSDDITTRACALPDGPGSRVRATIVARKPAVAAGFAVVGRILRAACAEGAVKASALSAEGGELGPMSPWIIFDGPARDLLRLERIILNFLMRMAGIATASRAIIKAVEGTSCGVLHTRKTAPGHRRTDIYAALTGGASAHRRSLQDAVLVKENHLRAAASFQDLLDGIASVRGRASFVEIEVVDFVELKHAMMARPDRILLDNFSVKDVGRAVNLFGSSVELEASGGIDASNARDYASTGVDFISVGALTHSAPAADLSMLFDFRA